MLRLQSGVLPTGDVIICTGDVIISTDETRRRTAAPIVRTTDGSSSTSGRRIFTQESFVRSSSTRSVTERPR
jgi:hypothetical protein